MRHISLIDDIIIQANHVLSTIFTVASDTRPNPADSVADVVLSETEKKQSVGYMRVNHTGEVCAQALYRGQLMVCQSEKTRNMLEKSCAEEIDHLVWTKKRLDELQGKPSYLNLFWYTHSFLIGMIAGIVGDQWSLGFVEETEIQVTKHLQNHLEKLSLADLKSRAIVEKMREEEIQHEAAAVNAGARPLPIYMKQLMQLQAKWMTTLVYYI